MPTNANETIRERFQREHNEYVNYLETQVESLKGWCEDWSNILVEKVTEANKIIEAQAAEIAELKASIESYKSMIKDQWAMGDKARSGGMTHYACSNCYGSGLGINGKPCPCGAMPILSTLQPDPVMESLKKENAELRAENEKLKYACTHAEVYLKIANADVAEQKAALAIAREALVYYANEDNTHETNSGKARGALADIGDA